MKLYERLGFLRSKKLHRYYLNGNSAYRLILYVKPGVSMIPTEYGYDPYGQDPEEERMLSQENGEILGQHIV